VSKGTLTRVEHFDSKSLIETYIRSLGIPSTFLMPGCYMNTISNQTLSLSPSTKRWTLTYPMAPTTKLPLFAAEFDTGKFVKAILMHPREKMLGKTILAAAAYLTLSEILSTFKDTFPVAGKNATFLQLGSEEYEAMLQQYGMPEAAAMDLSEMMKFFEGCGYFGGEGLEESLAVSFLAVVGCGRELTDMSQILDEPPTTWRECLEGAEAFRGLN
jgi:hypothetical protein